MKFSVEKKVFSESVLKLSRIVSTKTSYPVLEGILINAEQGKLTLTSYNLETGLKHEIYAHTEVEGSIVISARLLGDIIRRMNGNIIEVETDARLMCHIKSEGAVFDIMGMAATDYPEMPSLTDGKKLKINANMFLNMVNDTAFAVAPVEGTRPILTGLCVTVKDNILQFVAIDGYRLAIKREKIENTEDLEFIIYGRSLTEITKLITETEEDIEMIIGKNIILFNIGGYTVTSRLIEGEFVNYQKTIPNSYNQRIVVKVNDIINIIERISLLINDSFLTPVRCLFKEENVTFSCITSMGRATENYGIDLEGEPFEIGLSSRYLLEALKSIDDDTVQIQFDAAKQGVVIKPLEGDAYMYMIMPMMLKG